MGDLPTLRYSRPTRVDEALAALARPGACIYAGGTDLLPALGERRPWARFVRELVDIKALAAAHGITSRGTTLRLGALTTAQALATHPAVRRYAAALAEAANQTSAPALRGRGTIGGNLTTPHPAGDVTTALLALGASVEVAEGDAVRTLPLADFMSAQAATWPHQQLVLAVRVRRCRRSAFERLAARAAFSRALVAVAVAVVDRRVQVALGGLRARPFLATSTAAAARRSPEALAAALADECRPPNRDDAPHRLRLAAVLIRRALARVTP
jgi:CO/xanthine dehydrogenase FAD-binding subunit